MKILTVSNVPLEAHLGSGYVITGYADRLRAAGHDVRTLAPCDYEPWPRLRSAKRLRMLAGYSQAVLRALRRDAYDLVELWGGESWWVAGRVAQWSRRPMLVGRSNGLETRFHATLVRAGLERPPRGLAALFDRWQRVDHAFRRVDALVTVNSQCRDFALARGYQPAERILTLENPLPDHWLEQTYPMERPPVIGFVGSWLPVKGVDLFVPTIVEVLRAHPAWRVRLVGVGDLRAAAIFPSDVAARIEVHSFVADREMLRGLYRETAILVLPSVFESFGLAAAEGMACGCALAASPTGLAAALRPGEEAVIVTERSVDAWIRALNSLIADEGRRRRIAEQGWRRVQSLRWSDAVERLLRFYAGLRPARSA